MAKELIKYISERLGLSLREINDQEISSQEKIHKIVEVYFKTAVDEPALIEYFLRVYLSNREVFSNGCEGMICVSPFVTEVMVFFEEGVSKKELRNQDFFTAFGLLMGYLGGMVFLHGEHILPQKLSYYVDDISNNIYLALKRYET